MFYQRRFTDTYILLVLLLSGSLTLQSLTVGDPGNGGPHSFECGAYKSSEEPQAFSSLIFKRFPGGSLQSPHSRIFFSLALNAAFGFAPKLLNTHQSLPYEKREIAFSIEAMKIT